MPTPMPTEASIAWSPKPNAIAFPAGDAVRAQRQGDCRLQQPDVPRPERKERRHVHQQQHEPGRGQRRVDVEGPHRHVDREELEEPAEALEERGHRGGPRRMQHAEPVPAPSSRAARMGPSPSITD